jgi:hypothetical protein
MSAKFINKSLFVSILLTTALSTSAFGQKMSRKFILKNAPVVSAEKNKDLTLISDKPNDKLIRVQKRSSIEFANTPIPSFEIRNMFIEKTVSNKNKNYKILKNQLYTNGFRVFNNFVHGMKSKRPFDKLVATDEAQFWFAIIPKDAVASESIFQMEWFGSGAGGHAQIRVKLNSPILLVDPNDDKKSQFIVGDFVYTLMAIGTENGQKSWGPLPGLTGVFANTYMLASTQHMANVQVHENYIEQFSLKLSSDQNQKLLGHVLNRGSEVAEKEIYNLVYNSCIHAALKAVNAARAGVDTWLFNPYLVVPHLKSLGIIAATPMISFNDEFKGPQRTIETPENKKALELINKNLNLIQSPAFQDSIRLLAQTVIEDRWTYNELDMIIHLIADSIGEVQKEKREVTAGNVLSVLNKKIKNLNDTSPQTAATNQKLQEKAKKSIANMTVTFVKILRQNGMSMDELIEFIVGINTQS